MHSYAYNVLLQMIRWMCGVSLKDRRTSEELRKLVGVSLEDGHVIRKSDNDWVKKCMGYRVEGRKPVGQPRRTWLESVEMDMTELEIYREDVYDRKK